MTFRSWGGLFYSVSVMRRSSVWNGTERNGCETGRVNCYYVVVVDAVSVNKVKRMIVSTGQ